MTSGSNLGPFGNADERTGKKMLRILKTLKFIKPCILGLVFLGFSGPGLSVQGQEEFSILNHPKQKLLPFWGLDQMFKHLSPGFQSWCELSRSFSMKAEGFLGSFIVQNSNEQFLSFIHIFSKT